jgi:hypothetical protein
VANGEGAAWLGFPYWHEGFCLAELKASTEAGDSFDWGSLPFCIILSATNEGIWLKERDVTYHGARRSKSIRFSVLADAVQNHLHQTNQERSLSLLTKSSSPPPLVPSFNLGIILTRFLAPPRFQQVRQPEMKELRAGLCRGRRHECVQSLRHEH